MRWARAWDLRLAILLALLLGGCCQPGLPAITGITISAVDSTGKPDPVRMARTRQALPIPLITVRPGVDPAASGFPYNEPRSGTVAITLAQGSQTFLLHTGHIGRSGPFVISLFLDGETAPSLTAQIDAPGGPLHAARGPTVMGLDGELVAHRSGLTAERRHCRIELTRAEFPLVDSRIDLASPWQMTPDNLPDEIGRITILLTRLP